MRFAPFQQLGPDRGTNARPLAKCGALTAMRNALHGELPDEIKSRAASKRRTWIRVFCFTSSPACRSVWRRWNSLARWLIKTSFIEALEPNASLTGKTDRLHELAFRGFAFRFGAEHRRSPIFEFRFDPLGHDGVNALFSFPLAAAGSVSICAPPPKCGVAAELDTTVACSTGNRARPRKLILEIIAFGAFT